MDWRQAEVGAMVVFDGSSREQVQWGSNDDPDGILTVGDAYEVEERDVHSWHTKLKLKGVEGWFNSASFSLLTTPKEKTDE